MANKDKFKKMQQGGGVQNRFQDLVQQATTVAAIEQQAEQSAPPASTVKPVDAPPQSTATPAVAQTTEIRFMRLPNPQIPITEYNLVTRYCEQFPNMTRQDFVELAIVEKLNHEGLMPDDDFAARSAEIRNRLPRGHRKGTRNQTSK